jgi:hypothetical protein
MDRPPREVIRPVPDPGRPSGGSTRKAAALSVAFPAAVWFFAGGFGLVLGLVIVVMWRTLAPSRPIVWGTAVACMALAPIALAVQGLPGTPVVGSLFGVQHMAAHRLVQSSMAIAVFAALAELLGLRPSPAVRTRIARFGREIVSTRGEDGGGPGADAPGEP